MIQHLESCKLYVGSACDFTRRFKEHRDRLRAGRHCNPHLQAAWIKYGERAFEFIIIRYIEDCTVLLSAEQEFLDCVPRDMLFNLQPTAGSRLGVRHTEATKAKIRAKQLGFRHTTQVRKALGDMQRRFTSEQCAEIRTRLADGEEGQVLALELGVSQATISTIKHRKRGYADV